VVEHSIGNGEVDSSILSGSTSHPMGDVDFIEISVLRATQTMVSLNRSMSKRARSSIGQSRFRVPAKVIAQPRGKRVLLSLSNESDLPFTKTLTIGGDVSFGLETDDRLIAESRGESLGPVG
jgi:hypothetical protein